MSEVIATIAGRSIDECYTAYHMFANEVHRQGENSLFREIEAVIRFLNDEAMIERVRVNAREKIAPEIPDNANELHELAIEYLVREWRRGASAS